MKTITFKNRKTVNIEDEDANALKDNILKGAPKFQCFSNNGNLVLMVNLEEITCIE